jgi:hypothetical protein
VGGRREETSTPRTIRLDALAAAFLLCLMLAAICL